MDTLNLKKLFNQHSTIFLFLSIVAATILLYHPSLGYYFFQDDWFVLNWVRNGSFLSFWEFRTDIIYWRPISMPLFFFVNNRLFGLESLGFHISTFLIFFALLALVYKIFITLFKEKTLAIILTFLYAIWPIHFMGLSWLSTTSYILGSLFQVLSIILFSSYLQTKNKIFWSLSFGVFLLAIASSEFALMLPAIIFLWSSFLKKKMIIFELLPFFLVNSIYLIFRFVIFSIPTSGDYQLNFNHLVIDNYLWYVVWALNVPERFKELLHESSIASSFAVIFQYWQITFSSLIIFLITLKNCLKKDRIITKKILFGLAWFTISLFPVAFLANHSFNIYLTFAGIGMLITIGAALTNSGKIMRSAVILTWSFSSVYSVQFIHHTHWIVNEQAISKAYTKQTKNIVQTPQNNSLFLVWPPTNEYANSHSFVLQNESNIPQSLNYGDAFKVIYDDSTISTIFVSDQSAINLPENTSVYDIRLGTN